MRSVRRHPFYPDAAPQSAHIPMIIGNTHDETRLFYRDPSYFALDWDDLPGLLLQNIPVDIDPDYVLAEYRNLYPELSPSNIFFKATTAGRSWRAAIEEAQERAKLGSGNTFVYQLDFQSPERPEMGAPHTFDIPLVFGNLGVEESITGAGRNARAVSAMMLEAFSSFARTGKPRSGDLPAWQPYSLPNRETMMIDVEARMENDPRGEERKIFARVPYVQPGT
jgi:para-nitrobenzyl esterase